VPSVQIWATLISIGVSIPFAILQGYFTQLYEKEGHWVLQGDWRYLVSWLIIFALQVLALTGFVITSTNFRVIRYTTDEQQT